MDQPESLDDFLGKVLSSNNCGELGNEVLGILRQWKNETQVEEEGKKEDPPVEDS